MGEHDQRPRWREGEFYAGRNAEDVCPFCGCAQDAYDDLEFLDKGRIRLDYTCYQCGNGYSQLFETVGFSPHQDVDDIPARDA